MSLQLDIPDELFDAKPFYRTRESAEAMLREIKDHIKTTGEPHTWRHVGRGTLNITVAGRRMRRTRGGAQEIEDFLDVRELSPFPGFHMFSPKTSNLASRMAGCAKRLGFVDFGKELQERVREMTDEDRAKAARILSNGLASAKKLFGEANQIRTGFSPMSVATLKGWTKHEGCPVKLFVAGDENNFYIGIEERQEVRIELPQVFWREFGDLPKISTVAAWNEDA
jgi:hypothetical protein